MVKIIPLNTQVVFQNALNEGMGMRDFVNLKVKVRGSDPVEYVNIGMWNGRVPITTFVINPHTGASIERDYTGVGSLLNVPPIPSKLDLEVRTIRMTFSGLTPEMLAAIRQYDAKFGEIEIHRGIFDPDTNRLVDPAMVRFFGMIDKAPIKISASGGVGTIDMECVSSSNILIRTSGKRFSDDTIKDDRSGDRICRFIDTQGDTRIWWGMEESIIDPDKGPKERFFRR